MTLFLLESCEVVMADYKCSHYVKGKCKARLKAMIEVISDEDTSNTQKKLLLTLNGQHTCSVLHQQCIASKRASICVINCCRDGAVQSISEQPESPSKPIKCTDFSEGI
jgi:hypothetical protein